MESAAWTMIWAARRRSSRPEARRNMLRGHLAHHSLIYSLLSTTCSFDSTNSCPMTGSFSNGRYRFTDATHVSCGSYSSPHGLFHQHWYISYRSRFVVTVESAILFDLKVSDMPKISSLSGAWLIDSFHILNGCYKFTDAAHVSYDPFCMKVARLMAQRPSQDLTL